ncbi:putative transcription factor NAM family [Rosa chinensis]|uniref:Putative transcription factor NAM family n=1 Tax=Rosa chinensis TaxID=74649 RepID=A0A2P6SIZ8_ROSCH|nr:putative transcription factor NAM family [Rosa chinensis]
MSWGLFTVPPGYRLRPTDEELLSDLEKQNQGKDSQIMSIIPEIEVCKHEPRELPGDPSPEPEHHQFQLLLLMIQSCLLCCVFAELAFRRRQNLGRKLFFFFFFWFTRAESWYSQGKWYFFAPREYKYPKSNRSNRTTGEGSWKVTSKDRDIKAPGTKAVIGRKRTLTFYIKRGVLKPQKTGWVIHEYYLTRANSDEQIGDFVVCCLKYKSDNSDHHEDAPFFYRGSGSGSCSMVSNVANQAEENLASNEQVNVVPIPNGNDGESETGGGRITEAEERLAFKKLGDALQIPIGNQHEVPGLQIDPCNLSTSVEGQADRINSSDMNEEVRTNFHFDFCYEIFNMKHKKYIGNVN